MGVDTIHEGMGVMAIRAAATGGGIVIGHTSRCGRGKAATETRSRSDSYSHFCFNDHGDRNASKRYGPLCEMSAGK